MPPDAKAGKAGKGLKELDTVVQAAIGLMQQLQTALAAIHRDPTVLAQSDSTDPDKNRIDPLALARDAASLIRAHSTKLSLLLINEPFTPSAIIQIVRELTSGPVPSLAASLDSCHPNQYTAAYRRELAFRCKDVLRELSLLLQKVPKDGKSLSSKEQGFGGGKGSIALTSLVWAACDETIKLANSGVGGFFVKKVEEWRDTLKDVMEELKEWGEEEPDDDDESDDDDQTGEGDLDAEPGSAQDMLDELMNSGQAIPRADPDKIRPRLETSLKRLRLVTLLYQAIVKRRIKKLPTIPPPPSSQSPPTANGTSGDAAAAAKAIPERLDEVARLLALLPDRFGDLAAAFYDLSAVDIDQAMDQCFLDAFAVSELLSRSWEGGRDEFTEWTEKFQVEVRKE